jgi:hypothetical protein
VIDVKALQYTTPTALTRATKPFSIKRVSLNSRAAVCQRSLPFSVCRCPLRKYHGQLGSNAKSAAGSMPKATRESTEVQSRKFSNGIALAPQFLLLAVSPKLQAASLWLIAYGCRL